MKVMAGLLGAAFNSAAVSLLYAWGQNTGGRTSVTPNDNDIFARVDGLVNSTISSPVQVGSLKWNSVSSSELHTLAIRSDGLLFAFGSDYGGELGIKNRALPNIVREDLNFSKVVYSTSNSLSTDRDITCLGLTTNGDYYIWGRMVSDEEPKVTPVLEASEVIDIAAGSSCLFYISSSGVLRSKGNNSSGQLGIGNTVSDNFQYQIVPGSWSKISASTASVLAIQTDGSLWTWGVNNSGQLGDGTTIAKSSPVKIGNSSWIYVNSGYRSCAAITIEGFLYTWGENGFGGLGLGDTVDRSSPVQVGTSTWKQVSMSIDDILIGTDGGHTLAIQTDGSLWAWGKNTSGELGDGTTISKSSPVKIGNSSWVWVAASGGNYSFGVTIDGALWAWGDNSNRQLGDNTTTRRSSPIRVGSNITGWQYVYCDPNEYSYLSYGIANNKLYVWTAESAHVDVWPGYELRINSPTQVGTSSWAMVNAGNYYSVSGSSFSSAGGISMGITRDKKLVTWGHSGGTFPGFANNYIPVTVSAVDNYIDVSSSSSHVLLIRQDGSLYAAGSNNNGQLGIGTTSSTRSGIVKVGNSSWSKISAGAGFSSAIRIDGALFTWGANFGGQLGDGTTIDKSSPVKIGNSSWSMVSSSLNYSIAITSDKFMFTWGSNIVGQLGDGTTIAKSSPVQIGTLKWSDCFAHLNSSFAIRADNSTLWAWGDNSLGQLGDGTTIRKSSPVQVGTSTWKQINGSAGITK